MTHVRCRTRTMLRMMLNWLTLDLGPWQCWWHVDKNKVKRIIKKTKSAVSLEKVNSWARQPTFSTREDGTLLPLPGWGRALKLYVYFETKRVSNQWRGPQKRRGRMDTSSPWLSRPRDRKTTNLEIDKIERQIWKSTKLKSDLNKVVQIQSFGNRMNRINFKNRQIRKNDPTKIKRQGWKDDIKN